jgi:hypothetical protein
MLIRRMLWEYQQHSKIAIEGFTGYTNTKCIAMECKQTWQQIEKR